MNAFKSILLIQVFAAVCATVSASDKDSLNLKKPAESAPQPETSVAGCEFGHNKLFGDQIKVYNLGMKINTQFSEYNQVLNQDEDFMLFTARRDSTTGEDIYKQDRQYYEDIMISQKVKGVFAQSKKLENAQELFPYKINTAKHEAPVFLAWDEKRLIIFKEDKLWYSDLGEEGFGEPVKYPDYVNRDKYQRHASYTSDGNTIYFSSEVRQSQDPKRFHYDIFKTTYNSETQEWSKPEALPYPVNTPYNEDSPEISQDGEVMYFSSDRLEGYGGYDIYRIDKKNDTAWTKPMNLCEPINSPANDIFFKPARDGHTAYFSSNRLGGFGGMDIYKVILDVPQFADCEDYEMPEEGSDDYLFLTMADTIYVGQPFIADGAKSKFKGQKPSNFYWKLGDRIVKNTPVLEQKIDEAMEIELSMAVSSINDTMMTIEYACVSKQIVVVNGGDRTNSLAKKGVEIDELMSDSEIMIKLDNILSTNPLALVNDIETTQKNTPVEFNILVNDATDVSGLSIVSTTQPANGTIRITDAKEGLVLYNPVTDFTGVDNFEYTAINEDSTESQAFVVVKVLDEQTMMAEQALQNDYKETMKNVPVDVSVLSNDKPSSGTKLTVINLTQPANGTSSISDSTKGIVNYIPKQDFVGMDVFTYTAEGEDGKINTALVRIKVGDEVQLVETVNDLKETMEGQPVSVNLFSNDSYDAWNSVKLTGIQRPVNGNVKITNETDGVILYFPNKGFIGTETFTYTASNGTGGQVVEGVTIIVKPDERLYALELKDDYAKTNEEVKVFIPVLDNDKHKQGLGLKVYSITQPANGTAEIVSAETGKVAYTPNAGFNGTDNFRYTAVDELGIKERALVKIDVSGKAEMLLALADDKAETRESEPVSLNILNNDQVIGGGGIQIVSVETPANGTVVINSKSGGGITYTPNMGFTGQEVFLYEAKDEKGNTASAKVVIDVKPAISMANVDTENLPDLELKPIYFDFDKDYIRKDARETMAYNIEVLKNHPDVIIKVLSHCDSRGSDAYNIDLSNRRAKNTVKYLIEVGGISKDRIIATVGRGERELVNDCGDGEYCPPADHQLNRRSDLVIVAKVKE